MDSFTFRESEAAEDVDPDLADLVVAAAELLGLRMLRLGRLVLAELFLDVAERDGGTSV